LDAETPIRNMDLSGTDLLRAYLSVVSKKLMGLLEMKGKIISIFLVLVVSFLSHFTI